MTELKIWKTERGWEIIIQGDFHHDGTKIDRMWIPNYPDSDFSSQEKVDLFTRDFLRE